MYRLRSTEIFHHAENALPQRGEHAAEHADVLCFAKLHNPTDPDPFEPGEPILGDPIKFTVTVTPWVDAPQNLNM